MGISKVTLNGVTQMDISSTTATAPDTLEGKTFFGADGEEVTGTIPTKTSANLTASGATVTAPAGYYASNATKTIGSGSVVVPSPTMTITSVSNTITQTSDNVRMDITGSKTGTIVATTTAGYVTSSNVTSGTATAKVNARVYLEQAQFSGSTTTVSGSTATRGKLSCSTSGYIFSGTTVQNAATIKNAPTGSTSYVDISNTSEAPTLNGSDLFINQGYVDNLKINFTKLVSSMTLPTSASASASGTTKATISRSTSDQYINIPTGYNSAAANYKISAVPNGSATTPATTVTVTPSITVSSAGLITATASGTKSVTPTVSAGYVSSGTAGTITVSGSNTQQLTVYDGSWSLIT